MSNVTEVEMFVSKKVQEDEYEPFTVGSTVTAEVAEGETVEEVQRELYEEAMAGLEDALMDRRMEQEMEDPPWDDG